MAADPILQAFEALAARDPEGSAVVSASRLATRSEILRQSAELASRLREHAHVPGRLIGLVAPNGPGYLVGLLALRRLGLVAVLCDLASSPHALEEVLARFDVAGCLSLAESWPRGADAWTFVTRLAPVSRHLPPGVAVVKLTSGSTGTPRGVVVSARALLADEAQLAASMGLTGDDRHLGVIPFSHSYGFSSLVLPALVRGATIVVPDGPAAGGVASPMSPLETARDLEATFFPTAPAWLSGWTRLRSPPGVPPTLRRIISAGAPLRPDVARAVRERFGVRVHVFYGASECGGIAYDREGGAAERGTVGTPVEGVRIETDPESGRLRVRSAAVAEGYLPATGSEIGDGAFLTSDLGGHDGEEIRLLGRADGLVIVKGKNVQPGEVENVLRELAGVDEVCVLGVDGPEGPRTLLRAVIATRDDSLTYERVLEHCRGRLAEVKVPRNVVFVAELPRDGRGKLDRRALAGA
ncbi:MAG: class I adenylate-forming enzyme family protein [Thermoanaerobaculia bacterium]